MTSHSLAVTRHLQLLFASPLQGEQWKRTTLYTALLFPGVCSVIFFGLNLLVWGQKSSGAVPFGTLFALCFLWFGISVPLVFVGSYFGYKAPAPEDPVRTNKIPRQIPEQVRVQACMMCKAAYCWCLWPVQHSAGGLAASVLTNVSVGMRLGQQAGGHMMCHLPHRAWAGV